MKKVISMALLVIVLLLGPVVFAGDVPESLKESGMIFFGEVVDFHAEKKITVIPTQIIKGNIEPGAARTFDRPAIVGEGWQLETGKVYLMTNYDEINPLYVLKTDSFDTDTLKIEGIDGYEGMWARFQMYLNNGDYGHSSLARGDFQDIIPIGGELPQTTEKYWAWMGLGALAICAGLFVIFKRKK